MSNIKLRTAAGGSITLTPENTASDITLTVPGDNSTLVSAADIAASGGSGLVGYQPAGTGAVTTTVQQQLRNIQSWSLNVKDAPFYAKGDGTTDDTAAIQSAIDYANSLGTPTRVEIPSGGVFIVSVAARTGIAAGVAGLVLKDNVTLVLNGTLKAKANIYGPGTLSALIKAPDVGITNAGIVGTGAIDGNRDNQTSSTQCDNIYLRAVYQVSVSGIKSINANGNGILIDKAVGGANHVNTSVTNTSVNGCNTIGIQVSHSAANLVIANNTVTSCVNNCIDVYHENGTTSPDPGVITIIGNTVSGGLVGIFPETTANCSVTGNAISACTYAGISTNRVNGAPANIVISGNNIRACPYGIIGSGDTQGVMICTNTMGGFTSAGVYLSGTTVSSYTVHGNIFIPAATTTPIIKIESTVQAVWNQVFNNVCNDPSHNSAYGIVTVGTVAANNTIEPIIYSSDRRPVKNVGQGTASSGGTSTIVAPASSAGKLVIWSTAGGTWESVWSGSFTSSASRVSVAQESSTFTAPGNAVASVVGSASTLNITINWTATGGGIYYKYWVEYI